MTSFATLFNNITSKIPAHLIENPASLIENNETLSVFCKILCMGMDRSEFRNHTKELILFAVL